MIRYRCVTVIFCPGIHLYANAVLSFRLRDIFIFNGLSGPITGLESLSNPLCICIPVLNGRKKTKLRFSRNLQLNTRRMRLVSVLEPSRFVQYDLTMTWYVWGQQTSEHLEHPLRILNSHHAKLLHALVWN